MTLARTRQKLLNRRWFVLLGICLLLWLAISWFIAEQLTRRNHDDLVAAAGKSSAAHALIISRLMGNSIENLKGIAAYTARDPATVAALHRAGVAPAGSSLEQRKQRWGAELAPVNANLALAAKDLGVDILWLMNPAGDSIAASNAAGPASFVGTNYADREYFKAAAAGLPGNQYAMGRRTKVPGIYFSAPVRAAGKVIGVVAVKIDLPRLTYWVNQADAFVSDAYDVIILARDPALEMHALPGGRILQLSPAARLARYKRGDFPVLDLGDWRDAPGVLRLGKTPLLMASRALPGAGIRGHLTAISAPGRQWRPAAADRRRQPVVRAAKSAVGTQHRPLALLAPGHHRIHPGWHSGGGTGWPRHLLEPALRRHLADRAGKPHHSPGPGISGLGISGLGHRATE